MSKGELGAKAFGELKEQLRTIRSDKDRVRLLKQAVSESFVTSDQPPARISNPACLLSRRVTHPCSSEAVPELGFVHEVVQLIAEQVSYDAKNQTAIACHPRLSDPAKFDKVLAALKFPEDREEVKKALGLA